MNIVELLTSKNLTISSIESFTVGKFGSSIGEIPGASKVYVGSVVSYATRIKADVVHVPQDLIDNYGVVSHEVARSMCLKGRSLMDSDICVSFTGNAGPSVMENKEAGEVYIGINYLGDIETYKLNIKGTRNEVVSKAIEFSFKKLYEKLG